MALRPNSVLTDHATPNLAWKGVILPHLSFHWSFHTWSCWRGEVTYLPGRGGGQVTHLPSREGQVTYLPGGRRGGSLTSLAGGRTGQVAHGLTLQLGGSWFRGNRLGGS